MTSRFFDGALVRLEVAFEVVEEEAIHNWAGDASWTGSTLELVWMFNSRAIGAAEIPRMV